MVDNYKINREKETFVYDDGTELPIPRDKLKEVLRSKHAGNLKEKAKSDKTKKFSKGFLPESLQAVSSKLDDSFPMSLSKDVSDYASSAYGALTPGEGQEEIPYLDRLLENYYASVEGEKEANNELYERNPTASGIGTALGTVGEIATMGATRGAIALPVLGAAHSETSFLEPWKKAKEMGKDAVTGFLFDRFFGAANAIAGHRGARRGVQQAGRAAEEANAIETQRALQATEADALRHSTETATRDAQMLQLPKLQNVENQSFIQGGEQAVQDLVTNLKKPVNQGILGIDEFISKGINQTSYAGTVEGNRVTTFLKKLFKGDEHGNITGQHIQRAMKAIDERIVREGGVVGNILKSFKGDIAKKWGSSIPNGIVNQKYLPKLTKDVVNKSRDNFMNTANKYSETMEDINSALGDGFLFNIAESLELKLKDIIKKHSGNFTKSLSSGKIEKEALKALTSDPLYIKSIQTLKDPGMFGRDPVELKRITDAIETYPFKIVDNIKNFATKNSAAMSADIAKISQPIKSGLKNIPGNHNVLPQPPMVTPRQTIQPNLQPVPQVPDPQGVYQRLAYGLENMGEQGVGGMIQAAKNNATGGAFAAMAGVPVGKMAAAGAAGLATLSALTSPSAFAGAVRTALEQSTRMIGAVKERAQQYPSHRANGVLEDPMERRSLVKEIEDDMNMSIEDKAITQSKVNRGQPLVPEVPKNIHQNQDSIRSKYKKYNFN